MRAKTSIKWSRVDAGRIPADIAELDFDIAPPIRFALEKVVRRSDFGYPDFSSGTPVRLCEEFGDRMVRRFGWTPATERVEVCAQIMQAFCCALLAFTRPGDVVVTHAPTYRPVLESVASSGRRCVTLPATDLHDAEAIEEAVRAEAPNARVALIYLCQPHNPTGHVFDARSIEALGEFAQRHDAVVFADEVHQDFVFAAEHPIPAATPAVADRLVTFTSAAKSFNIAGLRCAVGHFGTAELHRRYCALPWHLRSGASLPGIEATRVAWREGDDWLRALRARLRVNRRIAAEVIAASTCVRWDPPAATYLAWLDLGGTAAARNPEILRRATVKLQPGIVFGARFKDFARLNLGTSEERLHVILQRLTDALRPGVDDTSAHVSVVPTSAITAG